MQLECFPVHLIQALSFFFFNLMFSRLVISDFGAQENKVYYCFHYFPISLP